MEIKLGHFYVRNTDRNTPHFLRVGQDTRGYFYILDRMLTQYLEKGSVDDLDKFEVIHVLPRDFQAEYTTARISIDATNNFGHQVQFGPCNLLRLSEILAEDTNLAKALGIGLVRARKQRNKR